jgi:F-type H+-transporting ATPase subunit gamma
MDVADAYSKLSNTQDRNRVSQELFGRSAVQMSALLKDGSLGIRAAVEQYEKTNANFHLIEHMIAEIFHDAQEDIPKDFLEGEREINKVCYIVITSNKGLCGGFNSNVIRAVEESLAEEEAEPVMITIGTKGRDHFMRQGIEVLAQYNAPPETISFIETREASRPIVEGYARGDYDKVVLIYNAYVSSLEQEVVKKTLLPLEVTLEDEFMHEYHQIDYEPSLEEVFNALVGKWVETTLYGAIVSSATGEHAARRTAMEAATDNARDMLRDLTLSFNRARQSAITDEIIEVVSGSEAQH